MLPVQVDSATVRRDSDAHIVLTLMDRRLFDGALRAAVVAHLTSEVARQIADDLMRAAAHK